MPRRKSAGAFAQYTSLPMDEFERLLSNARALESEAEATVNASQRLALLSRAAETWLHINHMLKRLI